MIVKFSSIISCSSQHTSYPATNLMEYSSSIKSSSWLCARAGELKAEVIFLLAKPAPITGVDLGNYRCCSVEVAGATSVNPDEWVTIVQHEFLSQNDARDDKFKDQVQLFTKKELNEEVTKITFERVKVICAQPANLKVLFGLSFLILRTEDETDKNNLDAFGCFKNKKDDSLDKFKQKYLQLIRPKPSNFKAELTKEIQKNRNVVVSEKKSDEAIVRKRPFLQLRESPERVTMSPERSESRGKEHAKTDLERPVKRNRLSTTKNDGAGVNSNLTLQSDTAGCNSAMSSGNDVGSHTLSRESGESRLSQDVSTKDRVKDSIPRNKENVLCRTCDLLPPNKQQPVTKAVKIQKPIKPALSTKEPDKPLKGVVFSLSGYKNPERDMIRKKAITMGARYVFDTDQPNHGCTHLVCAFKRTPKYNLLKGSVKIVSHRWVEECFDKKIRLSWRRYALDSEDRDKSDSEDEMCTSNGSAEPPSIYDQDTDSDH